MVMEQLKDAFWEAVVDCLVQFHGFSRMDARAQAFNLRSRLERVLGNRFEPGVIYHDEPFYIAARLAGREIDLRRHWPEYDAIRSRRLGRMTESGDAGANSTSGLGLGGW